MAITTFDGLVAAMNTADHRTVAKASIATQGAGQFSSLWRGTGMPAQGGIPTATSDLRIKVGASYLGIPLTAATNDHAGSIRIKVGSTVYALKQS